MSVHIESSKTDQSQKGDIVLVAHIGTATCPIAMMDCYISMMGIDWTTKLHLFWGIVHTQHRGS